MWLLRLRYIVTTINRLEFGVEVIEFLGLPVGSLSVQLACMIHISLYGHANVLENTGITIGTDSMILLPDGI